MESVFVFYTGMFSSALWSHVQQMTPAQQKCHIRFLLYFKTILGCLLPCQYNILEIYNLLDLYTRYICTTQGKT